ncbi:MAG: hypothetical protein GY925_11460, partial [Actinomycetia bacterium]|nr:hypothetical protein [Actinomycetes bacterium]
FNYTVAHDLKNPLTTIRNFIGQLEKDAEAGDPDRLRRDLRRIDDAATKLHRLLDQLYEFSSIDRVSMPCEEVAFGDLVAEAVADLGPMIAERGVDVEVAADLPVVCADRVRLLEAVRHLLDNAVRYLGDQPAPRIEVGVRDPGAAGGELPTFYVRDNGMGIERSTTRRSSACSNASTRRGRDRPGAGQADRYGKLGGGTPLEVRAVKKQCVVLALSILPWPLVAQPPAPVTAEREENAARLAEITGRERFDLLVELTYQYHTSDPMQALAYGTEALEQLEEWGDDERNMNLFSSLTWIYYADGNYEAGLRYGKECEQLARASGDQRAVVRSLRAIAYNQKGAGAWGPALETFNEALALSLKLDDYQLGGILTSIGGVYRRLGDLEQSLQYHHRAYRHFEDLGDRPLGVAVAL